MHIRASSQLVIFYNIQGNLDIESPTHQLFFRASKASKLVIFYNIHVRAQHINYFREPQVANPTIFYNMQLRVYSVHR
jgi:hypothetical protein